MFTLDYQATTLTVFQFRQLALTTYNPYKYDSFVDTQDHEAQEWSEYAHLTCGDGWRNIEAIFTREYFVRKTLKFPLDNSRYILYNQRVQQLVFFRENRMKIQKVQRT